MSLRSFSHLKNDFPLSNNILKVKTTIFWLETPSNHHQSYHILIFGDFKILPATILMLLKLISVKIFISRAVSNTMNPWEGQRVPGLFRAIPPVLYARSHSVHLAGPTTISPTWIISWPDYTGLKGLNTSTRPVCTFWQLMGSHLQDGNKNHFHSHFEFHLPRPAQGPHYHFDHLHCSAYHLTKIWIAWPRSQTRV